MRARGFAGAVVVAGLVLAGAGRAGGTEEPEYLSQFVLMMDWVNRAIVYVPRHSGDTNLAEVAHAVAEVLVAKSERLTPPERLSDLHPHFVLVLENAERAFAYLAEGESDKAERHLALVRDEMRIMRQVQREIGIEIPELAL
ncbi:MAG: hypothetical protein HY907_16300 [Deltaproteobacteria bacterium]|nr:hypothetical protein [Deltaproteobacteria bacterium]